MEKLYIVFDKIPSKSSGGLVATYIRLVELLKKDYDIEIISFFDTNQEDKDQFRNNKINIVSKRNIDLQFFKLFSYLKKGKIKKFIYAIFSGVYYFGYIPLAKTKTKILINEKDKVIVSSPSAAIFMSKKVDFILELHIRYEYFFGKNLLGRMQSGLMTKPKLMLFRSQIDAKKAQKLSNYNASYIYNFYDNRDIKLNTSLVDRKNKIIFLGRLESQKNPDKLLRVASYLKKLNDTFILDIYGTGSMKEHIERKIRDLDLENNVYMKGFITDKNIYQKYSLLIMTSRDEGFPLTVIEAKANATPTVTNIWGDAVYETVKDGVDGFIIDEEKEMANKIAEILNNDDLLKKLSNNSLKEYERFSPQSAHENWLKILNDFK